MLRRLRRLLRDRRGATIIEFAMILPVMMILLMGGAELVYQLYVQSILDGAIQKAGRDAGIQGGAETADVIDGKVIDMVRLVAKTATYSATRRSYGSFSTVKAERFDDDNNNKVRDAGECFDDVNANNTWDADPGVDSQGGANDVTLYTFAITYPRLFPVTAFLGWPTTKTLSARTLLKNQPYASQRAWSVKTICT